MAFLYLAALYLAIVLCRYVVFVCFRYFKAMVLFLINNMKPKNDI